MDVRGGIGTSWYPLPPGWRTHALSTARCGASGNRGWVGRRPLQLSLHSAEQILEASTRRELIALLGEVEREGEGSSTPPATWNSKPGMFFMRLRHLARGDRSRVLGSMRAPAV